jgi:hypothetical protein
MTEKYPIVLVLAEWRDEARTWLATSRDFPDAVLSAPTKNELAEKVKKTIHALGRVTVGATRYDKIHIEYIPC